MPQREDPPAVDPTPDGEQPTAEPDGEPVGGEAEAE